MLGADDILNPDHAVAVVGRAVAVAPFDACPLSGGQAMCFEAIQCLRGLVSCWTGFHNTTGLLGLPGT